MSTTDRSTRRYAETPVQKAALIVGIVFLAVGVAGFIPGLTADVAALRIAGPESQALILGVFQVSILHNLVHLLFGAVGLWAATSFAVSRNFLIWGGAVYALLWLYGLLVPVDSAANFVPMNDADDWLHFAIAVAMILLGVLLGRRPVAATPRRPG